MQSFSLTDAAAGWGVSREMARRYLVGAPESPATDRRERRFAITTLTKVGQKYGKLFDVDAAQAARPKPSQRELVGRVQELEDMVAELLRERTRYVPPPSAPAPRPSIPAPVVHAPANPIYTPRKSSASRTRPLSDHALLPELPDDYMPCDSFAILHGVSPTSFRKAVVTHTEEWLANGLHIATREGAPDGWRTLRSTVVYALDRRGRAYARRRFSPALNERSKISNWRECDGCPHENDASLLPQLLEQGRARMMQWKAGSGTAGGNRYRDAVQA